MTLSLSVFKINEYSFSLANFIVLYLFIYYLLKNNKKVLIIYYSIIMYLLLIAILFIQKVDILEFIKSFMLTSVMLLVFLSSLFKQIHSAKFDLKKIISKIGIFIVFFEVMQIFEFLILGTSSTWFIFDKISISTATDIGRFQAVNLLSFMRPISFYHEPSYLGIVLLILLICAYELRVNKIYIIIYYIGIILSFSTTALVFLFLYIISKNINRIKNLVMLITILIILLAFFLDKDTLDNIFRFSEILNAGTSGNERLIGPYEYLKNQLVNNHYFFGIPLGQSELVFNNSFYLLFLYFGVFTFPLLLIFMSFIIYKFKSNSFKYIVAFFSLLFLNGAIFTLESALLLYCLNTTFVETNFRQTCNIKLNTNDINLLV